ncbi:DUF1292 domain-containing protein [Paenibacillus sp. CAA11]|uniref:DUF1292 domain-containing protein n=1 Tax=Paenibacillus sp. CAA11 TaxID=1532905 RepID=UPI000D367956|nr:DUF1292 domain-containing protein [Paenibacillus sp. CAA11]AWB45666.1 DUF1292 domain-containing protein [Paenibacillus sp. CAA11]
MTEFSAAEVVWSHRIQEAFGPIVELQDEKGKASYYRVEKEFDVAGRSYAVLRLDSAGAQTEPQILKIITSPEGTLSLETIDDDDEWEDVNELYDELTFPE